MGGWVKAIRSTLVVEGLNIDRERGKTKFKNGDEECRRRQENLGGVLVRRGRGLVVVDLWKPVAAMVVARLIELLVREDEFAIYGFGKRFPPRTGVRVLDNVFANIFVNLGVGLFFAIDSNKQPMIVCEDLAIHLSNLEGTGTDMILLMEYCTCGLASDPDEAIVIYEDNTNVNDQVKHSYIKEDNTKYILPALFFTLEQRIFQKIEFQSNGSESHKLVSCTQLCVDNDCILTCALTLLSAC
ncbi:hypothetical protein LXL04_001703 [Taraxacum kok-saghyz]